MVNKSKEKTKNTANAMRKPFSRKSGDSDRSRKSTDTHEEDHRASSSRASDTHSHDGGVQENGAADVAKAEKPIADEHTDFPAIPPDGAVEMNDAA